MFKNLVIRTLFTKLKIKNSKNMKHQHNWAKLLAEKDGKTIATALFTCLKCGLLKIGRHTIRISSSRLDMGNLPIKSIKTGTFNAEVDNGNSGTEKTIDWTAGQKQLLTLTGNCALTFSAPLGPSNLTFRLIQDGTGSRTVTWPAACKWASGTAPTLSTAASAVDIISFYYNGTNYYGVSNTNFS